MFLPKIRWLYRSMKVRGINMKSLVRLRGVMPYIILLSLNALIDLGDKIILQNIIFKAFNGGDRIALTAIVNALILLPYLYFIFPPRDFTKNTGEKKWLEYTVLFAIVISILLTWSYYHGWFWVSFILSMVLAGLTSFYAPAKFALMKQITGNIQEPHAYKIAKRVTLTSILVWGFVYALIFEYYISPDSMTEITNVMIKSDILTDIAPMGYLIIIGAVLEYFFLKKLLKGSTAESERETSKDEARPHEHMKWKYIKLNLSLLIEDSTVWRSILGLSVLWGVSQVLWAILGTHLDDELKIHSSVALHGFLILAGGSFIVGLMYAKRISKNYIEMSIVPIGALGAGLSLYMMPFVQNEWGFGLALFIFGVFSGLFSSPLASTIQFITPSKSLMRVLSGCHLIQNVTVLLFLILTIIWGYTVTDHKTLFYLISGIAFIGMGYTFIKLPQSLVRSMVHILIGFKYNLSVYGLENANTNSQGVLLLGNHVSFLDWAILQMAYPVQIHFVMERGYYERWYLKPFFYFFKIIPISNTGTEDALIMVTEALNRGETVALFPEGQLSRTGHLGAFEHDFELATIDVEDAVIIPFYLRGLWEDGYSYASSKVKRRQSKDVSVSYGKPISIRSGAEEVKKAVFETSIASWSLYADGLPCLQKAWLKSAKEVGTKLCMADSTGAEVNGHEFITGTVMIAKQIKKRIRSNQNIGLILPTVVAGAMANMSLLTLGKTIVNLNYSSGEKSLHHALKIASIRTIITSRQFVSKLKAKGFDISSILKEVEVIYLEDERHKMKTSQKLLTLMMVKFFPLALLDFLFIKNKKPNDTAAILFSSGSEGKPKGIELSHKNLIGNIKQSVTVLHPQDKDVVLGVLPLFHSFGLTVTILLPLLESIPVVCHPDPRDSLSIGKLAAKYKATIFGGTSAFFRLYIQNKKLTPLMFEHLRFIVGGAEGVPQTIRDGFKAKFGKTIYQGYGATETTPAATLNFPDVLVVDTWKTQIGNKEGTVGLPVPGSSLKIVDPDTYESLKTGEDGMILIGGTQIMKGYIGDKKRTQSVIIELDGIKWYITGDKGHLDADGFLTIVDRYSRFAKIGGEMISLGFVESEISGILDSEIEIAVESIPDTKRGEKLVLIFQGEIEEAELKKTIKGLTINPLFMPSAYFKVDKIPKLGSGKSDFTARKKLVMELSANISKI